MAIRLLRRLCSELALDTDIAPRLISVVWIGSSSHGRDLHSASDIDLQIIMDRPEINATVALARLLSQYPSFDLSILYERDVFDRHGRIDFQDGTKGVFFIQVLAEGVVLHGSDFYRDIPAKITLEQARPSLMFTIREYLGRLRIMATQGETLGFEFKKYSLKCLKDLLVYAGIVPFDELSRTSYASVVQKFRELAVPTDELAEVLARVTDYSTPFTAYDKAVLLTELEALHDGVISGTEGST